MKKEQVRKKLEKVLVPKSKPVSAERAKLNRAAEKNFFKSKSSK